MALRGERFDGHHFVREAFARGAAAAADPDSIKALKQQYGMVTRFVSEVDGTEVVTLPDGVDVTKVLEELRRNPLVKQVDLNHVVCATSDGPCIRKASATLAFSLTPGR